MSDEDPLARMQRSITNTYAAMQLLIGEPDFDEVEPDVEAPVSRRCGDLGGEKRNPEADVLDAIDELVNETMAAGVDKYGSPLDNYSHNRYPDCPHCNHDWHGIKCAMSGIACDCPGSEGEAPATPEVVRSYVDQVEGVRYTDSRDGRGYTIADVEQMRGEIEAGRWIHLPNVRFWGVPREPGGPLTEVDPPAWLEATIDTTFGIMSDQLAELPPEMQFPPGGGGGGGERRELNWAVRIGTADELEHDEPICDNDPLRARAEADIVYPPENRRI